MTSYNALAGPRDQAVVAERLTKRFGSRTVVDAVSFAVPAGTVTGLVGPNGAGKTTIMGMLLGLVRPTSGEAWVLGAPVAERAGYLPRVGSLIESPAFHPAVSAVDNLRALAILAGHGDDPVDDLIDLVGLSGRGHDRYGSYSLGMKQRLGIAAALIGDPDLVILDEPTNGLDPVGMQDVRRLVRDIGDEGKTVIVSSHLLAELEAVCDWLIVVDQGGLVHCGPVDELGAGSDDVLVVGAGRDSRELLSGVVRGVGRDAVVHDEGAGSLRIALTPGEDSYALAAAINREAHRLGVVVNELQHVRADLEARFLSLIGVGGQR
ncbi:MAG TPA: ATP-binding cassette domain-containing protein [Ilumatobacter sp.]|nr:ATP-binding cassette domain-containing protein [Ilumatobacter sp.]